MPSLITSDELCHHPYRALFPLGWLMAWWGIAPWILFWAESGIVYPRNLHMLVLIQSVLTPMAAGFLLTMLPRRLKSPDGALWQVLLTLLVPPFHALLVWRGELGFAHALWTVEALMLLQFATTRVLGKCAGRRGPVAFVWVPIGFAFGTVGGALLAVQGLAPTAIPAALASFAWLMLSQGLFLSLVFGIGALFLPLVVHKEGSTDSDQIPDAKRRFALHGLAAAGVLASFILEARGAVTEGRALRAILALVVLIACASIHRLPSIPGTQRKLIWLASWCIPIGLALAAALPMQPQVGLHVFFLSGIALVTLSVALHVGLSHSTGQHLVNIPVRRLQLFGALTFLALALRITAEFDPLRRYDWLAAGAALFLLGLIPWGHLVLPRLLPALFRDGE